MLPIVVVRQDILQRWERKIDAADCMLIALIRSMDLRNQKVRELSYRGYVLLRRSYIKEMLPILAISEDRIGRRLKALQKAGLVDLLHRVDQQEKYNLYAKLSKFYWQAENAVTTTEGRKRDKAVGENAHGCLDRTPAGENTHTSLKDDQKKSQAPPPAAAAVAASGSACEEAVVPRGLPESEEVALLRMWRMGHSGRN